MAMSVPLTTESLREALRGLADPVSGQDIVSAGLVEGIEMRGGLVQVALLTDRANAADRKSTRLNSSHIQKSRMPSSA